MQRRFSKPRNLLVFLAVLLSGVTQGNGQSSKYFPARGSAAIHQSALKLQNPAVVLSIALEPGFEDLDALSYLSVGRGISVVSLYLTNGETTPSDLNGETPYRLAAERKVEAWRAVSHIGGKTHYLNMPDPGITSDIRKLERIWISDTVVARLTRAIDLYRPDIVLIGNDFNSNPDDSTRRVFLSRLVLKSVRSADGPGKATWKVQRVFQEGRERDNTVVVPAGRTSTPWKKSCADISAETSTYYRTLAVRQKEWRRRGERTYVLLFPALKRAPLSVETGLVLSSSRLRGLRNAIGDVSHLAMRGKGIQILPQLSLCIDTVDKYLGPMVQELTSQERRIATTWKNELENLRCTLLDLNITRDPVDSLVTERQLFTLSFKGMKSKVPGIHTQILFPGAMKEGQYLINESNKYAFEFSPPQEFRVITPASMEFNTPVSLFGLQQPTLGTSFPFIVFHKDSVHERNFVYRQEILLGAGPQRAVEVLTPVVRATNGEHLVFSILNISRDAARGDAIVRDSHGNTAERLVSIQGKNSSIVDTIRLSWTNSVPEGDDTLEFALSGRKVGYVIARKFDVAADTEQSVGLITGQHGSAVAEAIRRLGVRYTILDSLTLNKGDFNQFGSIVFDRDVESQRRDLAQHIPQIRQWVERGGIAVMLPQFASGSEDSSLVPSIRFERWPALEQDSPVRVDSQALLVQEPNHIGAEVWEGWNVARSLGIISTGSTANVECPVRSADSGKPLVATLTYGKGTVRYVSLDLISQLMNVHPGSFRLFANLLSSVSGRRQ